MIRADGFGIPQVSALTVIIGKKHIQMHEKVYRVFIFVFKKVYA